jgi:hypothetical protein
MHSDIDSVQNWCLENYMIVVHLVKLLLYPLHVKRCVLTLIITNCAMILFYVSSVSEILMFCWTVRSIFIT